MRLPLHPLAASHYWNKYFVRADKMHIMDLKGLTAIAGGSIMHYLVKNNNTMGRVEALRVQELNRVLRKFQSDNKVEHRMPDIRIQDLTNSGGWTVLCGQVVKAANTRCLVPFFKHLAIEYFSGHGEYNSSVRKVCYNLDEIETILYTSDMFLDDAALQRLDQCFRVLARHWQHLIFLSKRDYQNRWQITPKVHYSLHLASQARLINPRYVQNYAEESLIGRLTRMWGKSANGAYELVAQFTVLARYFVGLELRMTSPFY